MVEKATFGAGCFWGPEAAFRNVPGVTETSVGYAGGDKANPTYEEVCTGRTGHTEVVQVTFDPEKVSYADLLDVFWHLHDPTQVNRQGPDVGTQYRSAIYTHDAAQEETARASKNALEAANNTGRAIATEIAPLGDYWMAEDYHQQYAEKNHRRSFGFLR
jgi:peptide-methionine (S)-S-oxide reductase